MQRYRSIYMANWCSSNLLDSSIASIGFGYELRIETQSKAKHLNLLDKGAFKVGTLM